MQKLTFTLPVAPVGPLERALTKLVTKQAEVRELKPIGRDFRMITLRGDDLRDREWVPGDMLQIMFRGFQHRAYTPLVWSASDGSTTFLAHLHRGGGLASEWASTLRVGDVCQLLGPRSATDLTSLPRPLLFFGDETSFSTAAALHATAHGERGVEMVFEVTSAAESRAVLDALEVGRGAVLVERRAGSTHFAELERHVLERFATQPSLHGLFTGNAGTIQHVYTALRRAEVSPKRVKKMAYWAVGKKGKSHF